MRRRPRTSTGILCLLLAATTGRSAAFGSAPPVRREATPPKGLRSSGSDSEDPARATDDDYDAAAASEKDPPLSRRFRLAGEEFERPTPDDLECIEERQLEHKVQAFAVGRRCQHGFPQAFGVHPVGRKVSSGLFRLSCPLLVQAVDEWEGEGAVREVSDLVRSDAGLSEDFRATNGRTSAIRRAIVESHPGGANRVVDKLGQHNAERYLASGIAGVAPGQVWDVKCLHAHVADHLCRTDGGNAIGEEALRRLAEDREVDVAGDGRCWQQCDVNRAREPTDWKYVPRKNRQRLRSTRRRRRLLRESGDNGAMEDDEKI